jgi:hypothetical protein
MIYDPCLSTGYKLGQEAIHVDVSSNDIAKSHNGLLVMQNVCQSDQ